MPRNGKTTDRRALLAGLSTVALGLVGGAPAFAQTLFYPTYPKPGTPKLEGADSSRRIIDPPAPDYWPYARISGAGRPVTKATQDGGWRSGLSEVSYKGPEPRAYPIAPWDEADSGSAVKSGKLPAIRPIWDAHIRDTIVCLGGDGFYYMTGTTGDNCWAVNDGVELWRSRDLKAWDYLGLVWSIDRDGTWEKNWTARAGVPFRALWAPEIHFLGGEFYICHCISGVGIGVLKSTTGRAEGPYVHVLSDTPIKGGIDSTLFEAADGKIYLSWGAATKIREIKPDFSDFAGDWQDLVFADDGVDPRAAKASKPYAASASRARPSSAPTASTMSGPATRTRAAIPSGSPRRTICWAPIPDAMKARRAVAAATCSATRPAAGGRPSSAMTTRCRSGRSRA
ncbi:family 43 glycosylhydrolase [Caulobacter segnis]